MSKVNSTLKKLKAKGFTFDKQLLQNINEKVAENASQTKLSDKEADTLNSVLIAKASDVALMHDRMNVTVPDLEQVMFVCLPFLIPCSKTTILHNPGVSASVLSSGDTRMLEVAGITKNSQLISHDADSIAGNIVKQMQLSSPGFVIPRSHVNRIKKRASVWKLQAELLSDSD